MNISSATNEPFKKAGISSAADEFRKRFFFCEFGNFRYGMTSVPNMFFDVEVEKLNKTLKKMESSPPSMNFFSTSTSWIDFQLLQMVFRHSSAADDVYLLQMNDNCLSATAEN
jgi:hypothetical protein